MEKYEEIKNGGELSITVETHKIIRDVFLSHANADKEDYVVPFTKLIEAREISYWLDEAELKWGHSLLKLISQGLERSRFVIVFLSDAFLSRKWPEAELRAALTREIETGEIRVLPVFIANKEKILELQPFLRDKKYMQWSEGLHAIVDNLECLLGRKYQQNWEFIHPPRFRGHVWIKVYPRLEHIDKTHRYRINWGMWQYDNNIHFRSSDPVVLDFKKLSEDRSWPIQFRIEPPAYVTAGRGKPVIDINHGWKATDRRGIGKVIIKRVIQYFMPETKEEVDKQTATGKADKLPRCNTNEK